MNTTTIDIKMTDAENICEMSHKIDRLEKDNSEVWSYYNKKDTDLKKAHKRIALLELVIEKIAEEHGKS